MKRRLTMLQIIVCVIIYNFTITAFSWCFKLITDSLVMKQFELFYVYIWLAIFIVALQAISNYMYIKKKNTYVKNTMFQLKDNFLNAIFNYEIGRFHQRDITVYESFLFNDLSMYEQKIITGKFDIIEKIILLIFSSVAIIIINPKFLLLIVILLIACIGIPAMFAKYAKKFNAVFSESCAKAMDKVAEMMSGFTILRTFSMEKEGIAECKEAISNMEEAKKDYKNIMAVFQSMLIFATTILTLVIFLWGGKAVISNSISIGELITLVQLLFNIANPLMGIMTAVSNVKSSKSITEKYKMYIDIKKENKKEKFIFEKSIRVENLCFRYSGDERTILNNINYNFEKNKKYAIVGENGSGKSTLLKLMAGVIDMTDYQGKILIDQKERNNLQEESFWNNVSYIPQQVFLFKKGIIENIYLNRTNLFDDNYIYLIEKLDIKKLIKKNKSKDGYEYMKLSGGEKQKIAFIREILKNSEVILADEPDAALDPDAAAVIQEILLTLKKTCIVVTHRISSSLAGYDEILVMNE